MLGSARDSLVRALVDSLLAQLTEAQRVELHTARDRMDAMGIPSVWDGSLHSTDVARSDVSATIVQYC